jgi:DNA mismatch repair protein MutL
VPRIRQLHDQLVSQIAAGEVVERPSSVVKELVENALDAGARAVRVELEAGGKRRIAVSDDGTGMDRDDALLAFDRHATSKIGSFEELERVATLGFRGEALASIAAVAKVEMLTAERPGDGQRVRIEGGRVLVAEPAPRAAGTTLEVASLFFNVPARRKFLRTPETELRRALEVVQGYALARPDVAFTVVHEGRVVLDAPAAVPGPAGERARIAQIFGAALAADLLAVEGAALSGIGGFVGKPSTARGRRQFVFVNRRLVRDRALLASFYRAVRDAWRGDDFPALFLFLDLPPADVDVNVHPQKAEVRFRDPAIGDRVYAALRRALGQARGEEPAPLRIPGAPNGPLAWEGLGARSDARPEADASAGAAAYAAVSTATASALYVAEDVASGRANDGSPGVDPRPSAFATRLAEVAYAPLDRPMLPLSGRGKGPSRFRLLAQYKGALIVLEGPDGLYLLDQHVAHERILYERLRRSLDAAKPAAQHLLAPVLLELAPAERLRLLALAERLHEVGFEVGELSGKTLALTAAPAVLSVGEAEKLVMTLAATAGSEHAAAPGDVAREILDALAASQACKAAIKMHHPLSAPAMEALVSELFEAEEPFACPHGRPIVLQMSDADLERRFGRR